jgi:hypothetical protein
MASEFLKDALIDEKGSEGRRPAILCSDAASSRGQGAGCREGGDELLGRTNRGDGGVSGEGGCDPILKEAKVSVIRVRARLPRDIRWRDG